MNRAILIGRLVANPEFKITEKEKQICNFRIAIKELKQKEPIFLNVVTFDNLAKNCQNWLQKASMVLIEGRIEIRKYEEKEYYSIVANNVKFLKGTKIENKKEKMSDGSVNESLENNEKNNDQ